MPLAAAEPGPAGGPRDRDTHELIAHLLGARGEGVTEGAHRLQALGLIRCARGHIEMLDRAGQAQRSCECYTVVRAGYGRLLDAPAQSGGRARKRWLSSSA